MKTTPLSFKVGYCRFDFAVQKIAKIILVGGLPYGEQSTLVAVGICCMARPHTAHPGGIKTAGSMGIIPPLQRKSDGVIICFCGRQRI